MVRVLLVEDSESDAALIRSHIERYEKERSLEFSLRWLRSAVDFVETRPKAELILMDIDMPGMTGMEAARLLRENDPVTPLVFVTSLAQYAVEGYQVDAIDFMVKPISYEDFSARMDRVMRRVARSSGRTLTAANRRETRVFEPSDLILVESRNHDLIYHLVDGEQFKARGRLSAFEEQVAGSTFARTSKSVVVNLAHIRRVSGDEIEMDDGESTWIGRSYRKPALDALAKYLGGTR